MVIKIFRIFVLLNSYFWLRSHKVCMISKYVIKWMLIKRTGQNSQLYFLLNSIDAVGQQPSSQWKINKKFSDGVCAPINLIFLLNHFTNISRNYSCGRQNVTYYFKYVRYHYSTAQYSTVQYSATIWYRRIISISYNQIFSIGIISKLSKNLIDYGKDHLLPIEQKN